MRLDDVLEGKKTVAISGHVRPDGDCVGSCLSVYNYILNNNPDIEAHVYLDPIPNIYKFLKNSDRIEQIDKNNIPEYDLFICLDCRDSKRLGENSKIYDKAKRTFCVDHHLGENDFADDRYIVPEASSCCELLYKLMDSSKIDKYIAECIYTGIVTDTGVFQYQSTAPETMRIAADLMEKGIAFSQIIEETFFEKTYDQNRILGHAVMKSKLHMDGRIITSYITREEMDEFHVEAKHMEGIVEQLRQTKGVEVAIFFYQTDKDGGFKASTRAVAACEVNLAEICSRFGGGGHAKAAGFQVHMHPDKAVKKVVAEVEKELLALG